MIKEILYLNRHPDQSIITTGVMFHQNMPFAVTLEPPDRGNIPMISCIPTGEYLLHHYSSQKYPDTWQIMNVRDRDKVLVHWGSFVRDTQGCVLIGEKFTDLNKDGITEIAESKVIPNEGFNEFINKIKHCADGEVKLIIQKIIGYQM